MYKYVIDDETTKQVTDKTNTSKSILEQFGDVDKKYTIGDKTDVSLDLKEMTYEAPTKEEVNLKAEDSLKSYKNQNINSINEEYDTKSQNIDDSIEAIKQSSASQKDEIKSAYDSVKINAENDAIKRGLARSSIIVNKLSNYDNKMLNDLNELSEKTNSEIVTLNTEKDDLEVKRLSALNNFDIEYAVKLQEKIDSINQEIAEAQEQVIKYNNEIAEAKATWEKEQEQENYDRNQDLINHLGKYGTYAIETMKQNEKLEIAKEYFKSIDKQTAIDELKNNEYTYKQNLGTGNYDRLLKLLEE